MPRTEVIHVPAAGDGRPLTPAQKRFQSLVKRIEGSRATLNAWQNNVPAFRQAYQETVEPLVGELDTVTRQWAFALDVALDRTTWTTAQRTTLRELLCEAAANLLELLGDDPKLKALFDKHADVDFDTEQRIRLISMKLSAEETTGLDLGEDEITSEDELHERIRQREAEMLGQAAPEAAPAGRRPLSAAQKRRELEAVEATQSMREVYRKLASALHPDREPDPTQRAAKTALMQRVNQAHAAKDLLSLLQLQLEIEQIDTSHVASASDRRLRHYNMVLEEQLHELQAEVHHVATDFCDEFALPEWPLPNPEKLASALEEAKREVKAEVFRVQCELRMLDDVAATKRWLRGQRQVRLEPIGG